MMIELVGKYAISIFAVILLGMMFVITLIKRDIFRHSTAILRCIIVVNIVLLISEPLSWIFDGRPYTSPVINYTTNLLIVLLTPVLIGLWQSYMDSIVFKDKKRLLKRHYYQHPTYIIAILLIVNIFTPVFFSINSSGNYVKANFEWIRFIFTYVQFVYVLAFTVVNRKKSISNAVFGAVLFFFLPVAGSLVQLAYSELFFSWTMIALSVVLVYIFLETTSGSKDYLTGLYSRQSLDNVLEVLVNEKKPFEAAMIDLDHFKEVNDQFGHAMGDSVLVSFSKALQKIFHKDSFLARLGGDEFIILYFPENNKVQLNKYIDLLKATLLTDPVWSQYEFLSFSFGLIQFTHGMTADDILKEADHRMYRCKQETYQHQETSLTK